MPTNRKVVFANNQFYHLFNRGVERRPVFTNKWEFTRALDTIKFYQFEKPSLRYSKYLALNEKLKKAFFEDLKRSKKQVSIIAFCLMTNHFHFLVKQVNEGGISKFMAIFTNSYTKYFNTKYQRVGPLFQGIFKAVRVESDDQLVHLSRYIHLNPVTGFLVKSEDLKNYKWSSYPTYVEKTDGEHEKVLNFFKSPKDYEKYVLDQADYAKKLKEIDFLTIDKELVPM